MKKRNADIRMSMKAGGTAGTKPETTPKAWFRRQDNDGVLVRRPEDWVGDGHGGYPPDARMYSSRNAGKV